jgi:hypothetical protein
LFKEGDREESLTLPTLISSGPELAFVPTLTRISLLLITLKLPLATVAAALYVRSVVFILTPVNVSLPRLKPLTVITSFSRTGYQPFAERANAEGAEVYAPLNAVTSSEIYGAAFTLILLDLGFPEALESRTVNTISEIPT